MESRKWAGTAICFVLVCAGALGAARDDFVRLWTGGALEYEVDSAAVVYSTAAPARQAGWRLRARLGLRPLACAPDEALLQLEVRSPRLELVGGARDGPLGPSLWDAPAAREPFYVHWRAGTVLAALLPPDHPPALQDYRRAIAALFQFQIVDGERNETDSSGACAVLYETLSPLEFRKLKSACRWGGRPEGAASRRVTRYTLSAARDALDAVTAEEEHRLGAAAAGAADAGVTARAWTRLRRAAAAAAAGRGACPAAAAGLHAARAALPAALHAADLPLRAEEEDDSVESELSEQWAALAAAGAELEEAGAAGRGGTEGEARVALRALEAARAADTARLQRLLRDQDTEAKLTEVARILGAAGSAAAHEAAASVLRLRTAAAAPPARAYLAALATAAPPADVVRDLLRLADDARDPHVAAAASLAAAAAARADPGAAAAARDHAARRLARCADDACRELALLALGNLARADSADLLLRHAEGGAAGPARAALRALRRAPGPLGAARLHRLLELAGDPRRPLEVRARAALLAAERSTHAPLVLTPTARRLARQRGAAAGELRRVLWQRLRQLGGRHAPVREFLRAAAADPELGTWHARAHPGTSTVVVRSAEWGGGGWRGELDSVTLARRALLRDASVALRLRGPAGDAAHVLTVGLWTRGLHALAGGDGGGGGDGAHDDEEEDEDAAAGLQLTVAGADMPPITLFSGQAALLAHVWAGTASTDTPVLRALLPLPPRAARVPLAAAGAAARLSAAAAASLALDARASLSLWARTGAARLRLRAALAGRAAAALAAPWARARVTAAAAADARLRVAADLDFYSAVVLCVRVDLDDHEHRRNVTTLAGAARGRPHARHRTERARRAGRSLALGRANDAACRALPAADDADDAR